MGILTRRAAMIAATAFSFVVSVSTFATAPAYATDVEAAKSLVESTSSQLVDLARSDRPTAEKRAQFKQILNGSAAMSDISKVAVGRAWKEMSPDQLARYEAAFADYLSRAYLDRLSGYDGETLEIVSAEDAGRKGVFVKTFVKRPSAEPLEVEWRVIERNGPVKFIDVQIEGVSLVVTQRDEFTALLDAVGGDIDAFIDRLEEGAVN